GFQVDGVNEIPVCFGDGQRVASGEPCRAVDQAVQGSETVKHIPDLVHLTEVSAHRFTTTLARRQHGLFFRRMKLHDHPSTLGTEPKRDCPSDSVRRTGDEYPLASEGLHVPPL